MNKLSKVSILLLGLCVITVVNANENPVVELEVIQVISVSPVQAGGISIDKIPANVQTVGAEALEQAQSLSMAEYMNKYMGSININDAQNNPFQPDVQYRGFTASPLLGYRKDWLYMLMVCVLM